MKNYYSFQNKHNTHIIIIILLLIIIAMIYMYHNKKNSYENFKVEKIKYGEHCDKENECDDDARCCDKNNKGKNKVCQCECSFINTCGEP